MRRRWPMLLVLAVACRSDDFDPASFVSGLRVIAVRAEPPELAPGQQTTLTVLAVDTESRAIVLDWFRCLAVPLPDRPIADVCVTGSDPSVLMSAGSGSPLDYTVPALSIADLGLPDSTGGFYVPLIARASAGAAHLSYGYRLRLAAGQPPNQNPQIVSIVHDAPHPKDAATGEPTEPLVEGTPVALAAGQEVTVRAAFADGDAESYDVVIPGATTRTVTESLSLSWFATGGSFSEDVTSPDKPDTRLRLDERVPASGTTIDLWVVGRDERGGADFLHRTLVVQ
jgi:hypothetical protein